MHTAISIASRTIQRHSAGGTRPNGHACTTFNIVFIMCYLDIRLLHTAAEDVISVLKHYSGVAHAPAVIK